MDINPLSPYDDPLLEIFHEYNGNNPRFLAAKLLDLKESQPSQDTIKFLFGKEPAEILIPYLIYTRATYQDLLYLTPIIGKPPPVFNSLSECEKICSQNTIKEVIAKLGWKSVNYGLSVKHFIGVSVHGSLPLFLTENEAKLFEKSVSVERVSEFYFFTAHGGLSFKTDLTDNSNKPVALFRSYNLAHANLLQKILDVAPLTSKKVKRIIKQMDKIVDDFGELFEAYSEECSILQDVYNKIKNKILSELEQYADQSHLTADITRLVQMFEDPHSIGEVHTLHGLKRYLHQKGLQLGFKLVDQSKSPNQSINLVLANNDRVLTVIKNINYADFESREEIEFSFSKIPYPIKVATEGFARQLLNGQESFPTVNIFCYGNEVHYFVWFRNHPIFIRIDFSPPLLGGMIDLQYFGVSNYEIADHPNIYLDAIKYFFQSLEFDVKLDGTHIHARYDKERALDLRQLCERVEYLFCLVPYLMDLDWVIGSLNLNADAKQKVIRAWAEFFLRWAALPINKFLTKDKLNIVSKILVTPEGEYQQTWTGDDEYRDRFTIKIPDGFFDQIFKSLANLGLDIPKFSEERFDQLGQIYLEKKILNQLRESLSIGEIVGTPDGFVRVPESLFQRLHEVICFTDIIRKGGKDLKSSVAIALAAAPLEQTLKFQTTGTVESFLVQTALLALRGENLKLYVLRDHSGIIRLSFFVSGNILYKSRNSTDEQWKTNANLSPVEFISFLRYNNYTITGAESSEEIIDEEIKKLKDTLALTQKVILQKRIEGEKILYGLRAAPGRATGRVLLGISERVPEDFDDHIFVASSISPDENTFLFHSAGIIATGGGILSHAGLIATQFNKPAIIITGKWKKDTDGSSVLLFSTLDYQVEHRNVHGYNITLHHNLHEKENQMRNGDLVVLDADEGSLQVLGQERDTIALFDGLKSLGRINETISGLKDVQELLAFRGKKLHIRHQLEKLFSRLSVPVLSKYALQEILIGKFLTGNKSSSEERAYLINLILQNETIRTTAEDSLAGIITEIENKFLIVYSKALKVIPLAKYPFEIVMPRLEVLRLFELIKSAAASIELKLSQKIKIEEKDVNKIDEISILRLGELRKKRLKEINILKNDKRKRESLRHIFRQLGRMDLLLNTPPEEQNALKKLQKKLEIDDDIIFKNYAEKFVLKPEDGAFALSPLVGWKAANLSELEHIGGNGLVPQWFVITDRAFQKTLKSIIPDSIQVSGENIPKGTVLRDAIDKIISRNDIKNKEKSLYIKKLWSSVTLPEDIKAEVIKAYKEIENEPVADSKIDNEELKLYVALRSSSCEEDTEIAARAGEFETYLFINGEEQIIEYLKKTWAGLWTERAIHNRMALGNRIKEERGGVIVQRIVWSRISGVLQTINVAKSDLNEIVINAGLGLGEGVVSGTVSADQIIVTKEGDTEKGPLHFNYITADKTEQVVFNKRAGYGTILTSTLYHQRFRPALEYVELCELVSIASRLEAAYGYPLDIEFGIEGTKLWILQVRPVATFLPAFKETLNKYPLRKKEIRITEEKIK
jgi:phosphoenolpyruvate synthase/pyruvate phosphate dikinase